MNCSKPLFTLLIATTVSLTASSSFADWNVGDPAKMTVPQLPDPNGFDINFTYPQVLADDWMCSETGLISDIHFWFSVHHDEIKNPDLLKSLMGPIIVSIHENIPASATNDFSRPGKLLWCRTIEPPLYTIRPFGVGQQGWLDCQQGTVQLNDHQNIWQVNIDNIVNGCLQEKGKIYWLDLAIPTSTPGIELGWKTSLDQFSPRPPNGVDDDAVWGLRDPALDPWTQLENPNFVWRPLKYPAGVPHGGESINLAFVITPEPGGFVIAALGGLGMALVVSRRRRRSAV